ncbi:MAG: fused PTS fructose transporter subunit IIA/HPr protein [Enterobacteriaceae bacterium]
MFQLSIENIHMNARAANKEKAIRLVAEALVKAGSVSADYVDSMLAREQQISTYLGNGIALPHGTLESRSQVVQTGVEIFQFPQGIPWGENDGDRAWIVIGITANSGQHLDLLSQLTHLLSDEAKAEQLKKATHAQELWHLLTAEKPQPTLKLDSDMLVLGVNANDLLTLQAINAARLKKVGAVDDSFVTHVISQTPQNLGQGIWLSDSPQGNLSSAVSISTPRNTFFFNGAPVSMLLTMAMTDRQLVPVLDRIAHLLQQEQGRSLLRADASTLPALLMGQDICADETVQAEFIVRNAHGLHTRPASVLVKLIKQFNSTITITSLEGEAQSANGRSMMQVTSLGVKQGQRLRFTACGEDASQALEAIGTAIASGLGENL